MLSPSLHQTSDPQRRRPAGRELNIHWIRWRFLFTGAELVAIDAIRICHGQVTLSSRAFRPSNQQIVAHASCRLPSLPFCCRPLVSNNTCFRKSSSP